MHTVVHDIILVPLFTVFNVCVILLVMLMLMSDVCGS